MAEYFWSTLTSHVKQHPNQVALITDNGELSWQDLVSQSELLADQLSKLDIQVLALLAENSIAWVLIDMACQLAKITLLPLPGFFSDDQLLHAIESAGADSIAYEINDKRFQRLFSEQEISLSQLLNIGLNLSRLQTQSSELPYGTGKITFTSGSTGNPKGVCLSTSRQVRVAQSLADEIAISEPRHLCVLPLSTLLENIGGIYAPLLNGGTVILLPQNMLGFDGSSSFDLQTLLAAIDKYQPNSMILLPELLMALVSAVSQGWQVPNSLEFIAVGGSKVAEGLILQAIAMGLPVYEGYGLSECSSVVSLNTRKNYHAGSAGKPLNDVDIVINDGEIEVSGNIFLGYVNEPETWDVNKVKTGDLGHIDEQGYLHIEGRKKNLLISSFGRNINPEWIESELLASPVLQQCIVFGDTKPYCVALLFPRIQTITDSDIQQWVDTINDKLPDYAQIRFWFCLPELMTSKQGLMTSNGRPVRHSIYQKYQHSIEHLYKDNTTQ